MEEIVEKVEVPENIAQQFINILDNKNRAAPEPKAPQESISNIQELKKKIELLDYELVNKMDEIKEVQEVIHKLEVKEIEEVEKIEEIRKASVNI